MNEQQSQLIKDSIKMIPDYPKAGIKFRDITSLLEKPEVYRLVIDLIVQHYQHAGITKVVGTEARGFLFGAPVALALNVAFIPVRKAGKLPRDVISERYALEYGMDTLEIHTDAINAQDKVLIIDDLLATGGTVEAVIKLIRCLGGTVSDAAFVVTLTEFEAAKCLQQLGVTSYSLVSF